MPKPTLPNDIELSPHEKFLDELMQKFGDLRNYRAENKFTQDKIFQKEFQLDATERILYLNYRDLWFARIKVIFPSIIMSIILILGGTLWDATELQGVAQYFLPAAIIAIIILTVFTVILNSIVASSYRYIITDRRIIIGYTFFRRWVRSIYFSNIVDIIVQQGLLARLFRTGSILVITGSNEGTFMNTPDQDAKNVLQSRGFLGIKHPFRVKKLLTRLTDHFGSKANFVPTLESTPIVKEELDLPLALGLGKKEVVFKNYRRKRASSFFKFMGIFVLIIFSLIQYIDDFIQIFRSSTLGSSILLIIGIMGLLLIPIFFWISKFHAKAFRYIVTNQRIIFYNDFINIRCRDALMGKITEVSLGQQLVGRLGDFGDIKISTKGYEGVGAKRGFNAIEGIPRSNQEKDAIQNIVLYFQRGEFYNPLVEIFDPEFLSL